MEVPLLTYPDHFRTPAFVVDMDRVRKNAMDMFTRAEVRGVKLRPHVKTHKTLEIAQIQTEKSFGGITVSTMAEAKYFAENGFKDILYAFPITPDKLPEAGRLAAMCAFSVLVDHGEAVDAITHYCQGTSVEIGVWIKIDTGANRAGLNPHDEVVLAIAKKLHTATGVKFCGVLTHAGQTYSAPYEESLDQIVQDEARVLVEVANRIEASGVPCIGRSLGSTPAARRDTDAGVYSGITEMRPGNYIFFDRFMAECGHCAYDEVACHVVTRIAGIYPDRGLLLIDAGALALSKDAGPTHQAAYKGGFGLILGYPDLHIARISQEHGMVSVEDGFDRFHIGQLLEIVPNHSCLTAALFPEYITTEQGAIVGSIKPVRGW
jgi:D-serine deaminase-like pyridoxal phosphate-dependent protein